MKLKELKELNIPEECREEVIKFYREGAAKHIFTGTSPKAILEQVSLYPQSYINDEILGGMAKSLLIERAKAAETDKYRIKSAVGKTGNTTIILHKGETKVKIGIEKDEAGYYAAFSDEGGGWFLKNDGSLNGSISEGCYFKDKAKCIQNIKTSFPLADIIIEEL